MKKILILLLTLMMCFVFASCGNNDSATTENTNETNETNDIEEAESEQFSEIVLFDTDEATMKVVNYDPDNTWGFALKVFLENKTDKTLMFAAEDVSINGYMIDPFWATEVAAGKKENTEISWFTEDLENNEIESVEDIEMKIQVYDSEDWLGDYLIDEVYTIEIPQ